MNKWIKYATSIKWKLAIIFLLLIIMAFQLIGVYFYFSVEDHFKSNLMINVNGQINLLDEKVKDTLENVRVNESERKEQLLTLLTQLNYLKGVSIQILDKNGFVIVSTKKNNFSSTPSSGIKNKFYYQVRGNTQYLTKEKKLEKYGNVLGSIFIEASMDETYKAIKKLSKELIKKTALALILTGILIVILGRTIVMPLREITKQALLMTKGDFTGHVSVKSKDEIGYLAVALNNLSSNLKSALKDKEEEKEKLVSVLSNMSDGVIATDNKGNIIVKNSQAEKLLGKNISLNESIFNIIPDVKDTLKLPITNPKEDILTTKNSREDIYTKIIISPIKTKSAIIGVVALLEDVTEEKKLDIQRKDFVANVSHELKTPLTIIKSYLEALEDGAIHNKELAPRFINIASKEADRMTRLIQELLSLSKLDFENSSINKTITKPSVIILDSKDRFDFQCKEKGIMLNTNLESNLPLVEVDKDKINQVLDNLLSNAVKYTPKGGYITIQARSSYPNVEISIIDSGIGIKEEHLEHIFERFYRVDKARSRDLGGTGLGLAIAKEIVEAHRGKILIESTYKSGTIVKFIIPSYKRGLS